MLSSWAHIHVCAGTKSLDHFSDVSLMLRVSGRIKIPHWGRLMYIYIYIYIVLFELLKNEHPRCRCLLDSLKSNKNRSRSHHKLSIRLRTWSTVN